MRPHTLGTAAEYERVQQRTDSSALPDTDAEPMEEDNAVEVPTKVVAQVLHMQAAAESLTPALLASPGRGWAGRALHMALLRLLGVTTCFGLEAGLCVRCGSPDHWHCLAKSLTPVQVGLPAFKLPKPGPCGRPVTRICHCRKSMSC